MGIVKQVNQETSIVTIGRHGNHGNRDDFLFEIRWDIYHVSTGTQGVYYDKRTTVDIAGCIYLEMSKMIKKEGLTKTYFQLWAGCCYSYLPKDVLFLLFQFNIS